MFRPKGLVALITAAGIASAVCSKGETKWYLVDKRYVYPTVYSECGPGCTIWSPARDQNPGSYLGVYRAMTEKQVRKLGLDPNTMAEYE
ncbi:MAG: hypothetical protein HY367_00475 [Candidatus Aenigmarchaeota archaeon]|nr:hypothetical protein [Candidatus Aenigmarchaeota archaeon]